MVSRRLALIAALVLAAGQARAQAFFGSTAPAQPANTVTTPSGLYNVTAPNLINWRKALGKIRAGSGRGKLVIIGDSTTAGSGAGTGGTLNQTAAFAANWPRSLVSLLNSYFVPTADGSFYNDQASSVTYATFDTRVAMGTGWSNTANSLAGQLFKFTNGTAGNLSFTPTGSIDTIVVRYLQQATQGSFATNVDGGASLGTTNATGASTLATATFTVTKGAHTINIVPDNLNPIFISGITAYDSTTPAVDLIQLGWNGSSVANYVTTGNAWSPMTALAALAPDLTIICLTVNDSNNSLALATYQSNLQTIITQAKVTGDVLLLTGPPSNTVQATNGTLDQYIAVEKALALANNAGLVELKTRWVSYAVSNAVVPYYDFNHPTAVGYKDMAAAVATAIGAP